MIEKRSNREGVVVITGATGMLGSATARALAARGANVVLVARDEAKGTAQLEELRRSNGGSRHRLVRGDLAVLDDVRRMASKIGSSDGGVRGLIHTAATLKPTREETVDGLESMFATNVLARLLLTHALRDALKRGAPSSVVMVTGPSPDRLDFDDLMARRRYQPFMQFRATNAANLMLAFHLAQALERDGVSTYAYHPGVLQSALMKQMPAIVRWITLPFGRTAEPAANALAALALGEVHDARNGTFFKLSRPIDPPKASTNAAQQAMLWQEGHRLLRLARESS